MKTVTAGIIEKDGKILLARRANGSALAGKWEFPGGKLESGETPEECLRRELLEEFGIETEIGGMVGTSIFEYAHGSIKLLAYRVHHIAGDFVLRVHDSVVWEQAAKLRSYDIAPADLPILDNLLGERE